MDTDGRVAGDGRPPSVDRLARQLAATGLPHPLLVEVARRAIEEHPAQAYDAAAAASTAVRLGLLQTVINATGVLLHTNLGRAPLQVDRTATYVNLELDLT